MLLVREIAVIPEIMPKVHGMSDCSGVSGSGGCAWMSLFDNPISK